MADPSECFDALLKWCQRRTRGYDACNIVDLEGCWKDGIGFCSILHEQDLLDVWELAELDPRNTVYNLQLAFGIAAEAGITQSLTPVDMQSASVTEARIALYLAEWYHFFKARSGNRRNSLTGAEMDIRSGILAGRPAGTYDRARPIPSVPERKQTRKQVSPPATPPRKSAGPPVKRPRPPPPGAQQPQRPPARQQQGSPRRSQGSPPGHPPASPQRPALYKSSSALPVARRKGPPRGASPGPPPGGNPPSPRGKSAGPPSPRGKSPGAPSPRGGAPPPGRSGGAPPHSPRGQPHAAGRPQQAKAPGRAQQARGAKGPRGAKGGPPRKQAPPAGGAPRQQAPPSPRSPRPSPRSASPRPSPRGSARKPPPSGAAPAVPQMPPSVPQMPQQQSGSPSKRPPLRAPAKLSKFPPASNRPPAVQRRIFLPPQFNSAYVDFPLESDDSLDSILEELSAITGSEEPHLYLSLGDGSCVTISPAQHLNAVFAKHPTGKLWLAEGVAALKQQQFLLSQWFTRSTDLKASLSTPGDPNVKTIINVSITGSSADKSSIKLLVTDAETCSQLTEKALRKLKITEGTGSFALVHTGGEYYFLPQQRILPVYLQFENESPQLYFTPAAVTQVRVFAPGVGQMGSQTTVESDAHCTLAELCGLASRKLGLSTKHGSLQMLPCGAQSPIELDLHDLVYPHVAAYDAEFCWMLFHPSDTAPPPAQVSADPSGLNNSSKQISALRKSYQQAKRADDLEEALKLKKKIAELEARTSSATVKTPTISRTHSDTLTAEDDPFGDSKDVIVAPPVRTKKNRPKSVAKSSKARSRRSDSVMKLQDRGVRRETITHHVTASKKRSKTGELCYMSDGGDGERLEVYACLLGDSMAWWSDRLCGQPINYLTLSDPDVSLKANRDHPGAFDIVGCFGGNHSYTFRSASGVQDTAKWIKAIKSGCKTGYLLLGTLNTDTIQGTVQIDGQDVWICVEQGFLMARKQFDDPENIHRLMIAGAKFRVEDELMVNVVAGNGASFSFETEDDVDAKLWVKNLDNHRMVVEEILSEVQQGAETAAADAQ